MKKKMFYNVLLNIGLVVLLFCAVAAYNSNQLLILAGIVISIILFIYLKVRLIREVQNIVKK